MLIRLFPHICANILYFALLATTSNGATIRETQGDLIAWVDTQKAIFETEADAIVDFTESNPFGTF